MEQKSQTRYYRDRDGWNGMTVYRLDDVEAGRQITVITSKRSSGKLQTAVSSERRTAKNLVEFIIGGARSGDYFKTWATSSSRRVTEHVVQRQHEAVLAKIEEIEADVIAHYARQATGEPI